MNPDANSSLRSTPSKQVLSFTVWEELPPEIQMLILGKLPANDLRTKIKLVSKEFYNRALKLSPSIRQALFIDKPIPGQALKNTYDIHPALRELHGNIREGLHDFEFLGSDGSLWSLKSSSIRRENVVSPAVSRLDVEIPGYPVLTINGRTESDGITVIDSLDAILDHVDSCCDADPELKFLVQDTGLFMWQGFDDIWDVDGVLTISLQGFEMEGY